MKIGFFGDSYVDLIWQMDWERVPQDKTPWSYRLAKELGYTVVSSGLGGTNQYYAIKSWHDHLAFQNGLCDYAVFSFTWHNRMYHNDELRHKIMRAVSEVRNYTGEDPSVISTIQTVQTAIDGYVRYLFDPGQSEYLYQLMVADILALPAKYPTTKFIFLPNTEFSRKVLLDKFTQGVLMNFTFEALSNSETNSPGRMPVNCGRAGHLNSSNHDAMSATIKNIIVNYDKYANQVIDLDLSTFDLAVNPVFDR